MLPEPMTLTLELPLPPNMANGRVHWAEKHRQRTRYFDACDTRQMLSLVPPPPPRPFPVTRARVTLTVANAMDRDNAVARLKWALDWLVTRGYIAGDNRDRFAMEGGEPRQVIRRGVRAVHGITFELTAVDRLE